MDTRRTIKELTESSGSVDDRRPANDRLTTVILVLFVGVSPLSTVMTHAQDATWSSAPSTADWNTAANWVPPTGPPIVPTGTASFGASNTTTITFSANASVGTLQFNVGAPAYSFNPGVSTLTITGNGVVNNSSFSPTFITNAGGSFDISGLTSAGMTAGSIEGAGSYKLGSKALTVGSNNLSTEVSGVIAGGVGGSLIKVGTGTLILSGDNTYTGGTTIGDGTLEAGSIHAFSPFSAFTVNSELDLHGFSNTIASLAGTGTVTTLVAGPVTLTAGADGSSTTFSGTMSDGAGTNQRVRQLHPERRRHSAT